MCGFLYSSVFGFAGASHARQLENLPDKHGTLSVCFLKRSHRLFVFSRKQSQAGMKNRFENNQKEKHYHFTIRRTQTRCLMNQTQFRPTFLVIYIAESCGRKAESWRKSPIHDEETREREKEKSNFATGFFHFSFSFSNETSNFLS